jgi:outer membrane protein OmpA-like peptidoglycan-associated protein
MLTACDSTESLKQLRAAEPTADPYLAALAIDYRDYAEEKAARYSWEVSQYFADKGLLAAYGRTIEPENPDNWEIPATILPQLVDARSKLMAAIAANRTTQPELTASAVVAYDRWVELQFQQWNTPEIEERRDVFFAILTKLEEAYAAANSAATPVPTTTTPVESTSTVLYFPMDSDQLGDSAQAVIAQLVRYIQSAGNVTVHINGHADRVGSEDYNMSLSERRARFVVKALEAAGIANNIIQFFAFGESDPAVATEDGVAEPKNRRVEIYIE